MCLDGARWVQENILAKPENDNLRVYVIWEPMMEKTDNRDSVPTDVITDPRVPQFWDEERVTGTWLTANAKSVKSLGPIAWDCFYAYSPGKTWQTIAALPIAGNAPVFTHTQELAEAVRTLRSLS